MEAGRQSGQRYLGRVLGQGRHECLPAPRVRAARPPQVPVESPGLDQFGQGQLVKHR